MLIVMEKGAPQAQIDNVVEHVQKMGFKAHPIPGAERVAIGITGNRGAVDPRSFELLAGVKEIIPVSEPFKLVGREARPEDSIISVGGIDVGGNAIVVIGGPCAVESLDQSRAIAEGVRKAGGQLFRGGAFKPRTSPYSFQGLGEAGLEILAKVREEFDLPIITEAVDNESLELVLKYADAVQIGARNMQNFSLLSEVGAAPKPVLLKRGLAATIEDFLLAAEYVLSCGNRNVILCERGIRTFERATRNTLDIAAIPVLKAETHLPVIVDPSHAAGRRDLVLPLALAAAAVGADGLLVEVHPDPDRARSDGDQSLDFKAFAGLMGDVMALRESAALRK